MKSHFLVLPQFSLYCFLSSVECLSLLIPWFLFWSIELPGLLGFLKRWRGQFAEQPDKSLQGCLISSPRILSFACMWCCLFKEGWTEVDKLAYCPLDVYWPHFFIFAPFPVVHDQLWIYLFKLRQCGWTCLCRFSLENFVHAPISDICTRWKAGGHGIFMHSLMSLIRSSTRIRWIKLRILSVHVGHNWSLENLVHSTYQVCCNKGYITWTLRWKAKRTPGITIPLVHKWRFKYLNQLFTMTGSGE